MCLKPLKIRNPVSTIHRNGGQKAYIEVPCGHCAECKKAFRLSWRFRSHYHVQNCLEKGGFVYFDTLTYSEEYVPRLSHYVDIEKYGLTDFYVFDNSHWRNFLKNLRRQLDYHYKGVKFTYFLTSEYGTDERYTHRPHYHPLFFINNKELITNFQFSELVSKCWKYGRTDGLPYQSRAYVAEHTYWNKDSSTMKLCNYVSKYVTKDSTFQKEIDNRLSVLKKHFDKEVYDTLKRQVAMFHRQSQGFGLSFLDTLSYEDLDYLLENNIVKLPDKDKIVATLPLPMYYKRHLYYVLKRDDEGKYFWQPNQRGLEYLRKSFHRNIVNLAKSFNDKMLNMCSDDMNYIVNLLNGRTLQDLATYAVLYKDRTRALSAHPYHLTYDEFPENYINTILSTAFVHDEPLNEVMHRDIERNNIYVPVMGTFNELYKIIDYDVFLSQHVINQYTCTDFVDFDMLLSFINSTQVEKNINTQITFEFIEQLEQKFKHLEIYGY